MEGVEAFFDGEWETLSKLFSCEDSDHLLHFNTNNLFSYNENVVGALDLLPSNMNLDYNTTSIYSVSQDSSSSTENLDSSLFNPFAADDHHDAAFTTNIFDQSIFPDDLMAEILQSRAQILCNDQLHNAGKIRPNETDDSCKEMQLKRKCEASEVDNISPLSSKKRRRAAKETPAGKSNAEMKKVKRATKTTHNEEEVNNGGSSCSSDQGDGSNNAAEEINGGSTSESKESTKDKGSKIPATDPQSLYARKRRERINERLRVLQNLVPNGTKVDISTMLEEAVQYVKFLQLQIKLLSSNEMWMYAPIAYNGMDIDLLQRIAPNM